MSVRPETVMMWAGLTRFSRITRRISMVTAQSDSAGEPMMSRSGVLRAKAASTWATLESCRTA